MSHLLSSTSSFYYSLSPSASNTPNLINPPLLYPNPNQAIPPGISPISSPLPLVPQKSF